MRYKQLILKVTSLLLIILLTQKMVGGLYLHNWLHGSKNSTFHSKGELSIAPFNCSCIDDFNIPFTEPATVYVDIPSRIHTSIYTIPEISLPVVTRLYPSLRGPPAA
jgi:hypothetical protein